MSQLDDSTKQALRFAAVGALLHNLGKINSRFLDKQVNNASNSYLFQHILGLIIDHADRSQVPDNWRTKYDVVGESKILTDLTSEVLKNAFKLPTPFNDRDYTIGDLIEYLGVGEGEPWYRIVDGSYVIERIFPGGSVLTHLMNRAHSGASGGEKVNIATAQQPDAADLYLSTPFGYETAAPNINDLNDNNALLNKIEGVIQQYLASPFVPFPIADFIDDLRPLLGQAIADTQRPLNDVTVGDIGHTGMSFMLTKAVEWILTHRSIAHAELANTMFWRVLTIHTDSLRYLEEALSLADLRVRQQQLQEVFQNISQQLEETLLAVEIYADEQRRLFVCPNLDKKTVAYQIIENIVAPFLIDGLRLTSQLSGPVTNHPDDQDKNGTYIGDQVLKQLQEVPPFDFDASTIATYWPKKAPTKQLCTACNLRPQGYGAEQVDEYKHNPTYYRNKAEERNICCICMDRRAGVAKKWAEKELNKTVWLDEVADRNGRLALIVGQCNLEDFVRSNFYPHKNCSQSKTTYLHTVTFLNGTPPDGHMFTINDKVYTWQADQSVLSGEKKLSPLRKNNLIVNAPPLLMHITVQEVTVAGDKLSLTVQENLTTTFLVDSQVKCGAQDFLVKGAHSLETVDEAGKQNILRDVLWDTTYPFIIQEKPKKTNVLKIISHGAGAKNESFARLRRIWQTTKVFWQTALDETDAEGNPILPIVSHRLEIVPQNRHTVDFGDYHAYDLKLTNSVKLSVVWDPDNKRFITCDNLEYLCKPELLGKPVIEFLQGELTIEEPSGYGSRNKEWEKITVDKVSEIENSSYNPVIPILAEPRTFMALVPADKAIDVVQAIKTKYEREMGKVRNRLPLHMGAVYFHRRTPLRAALDAGRRMLKYDLGKLKDQLWTVESIEPASTLPDGLTKGTRQFDHTIALKIKNEESRSLTWYVPARMADGKTDDNWYPYVFIPNDVSNRQRIFKAVRPNSDRTTEECWLIHAAELQAAGDQVYFTPATFDFQWLDSAGERFEIAYNNGNRRNQPLRPYLLDELTTIRQAWNTIAGKGGLTANQIYSLRDLIETKRENWQVTAEDWVQDCKPQTGMFWQFCRNAIINANWKNMPVREEINLLTEWAVSCLLADVIHLYMGVMKQKTQRKENNEQSE